MTDKERYSKAMAHDYPKDFIPEDEWDFIDSVASWGKPNSNIKSTKYPAPRDKGKGKNMANQKSVKQNYSVSSKCDYYTKRSKDKSLTDGQRNYALKRLSELRGGKCVCGGKPARNNSKPTSGYTEAQTAAYNAGLGYGAAKAGNRIPVKEPNKDSFRAGYQRGKNL